MKFLRKKLSSRNEILKISNTFPLNTYSILYREKKLKLRGVVCMNKIIMLLASIKNSNYIIEENACKFKELILKDDNKEKCLLIEFNTEVNHNYLWKIANDPFDLYEFLGYKTIKKKKKIIKDFYE